MQRLTEQRPGGRASQRAGDFVRKRCWRQTASGGKRAPVMQTGWLSAALGNASASFWTYFSSVMGWSGVRNLLTLSGIAGCLVLVN